MKGMSRGIWGVGRGERKNTGQGLTIFEKDGVVD
jgi:hypothetical protein